MTLPLDRNVQRPSNEYVLNVAFLSFLAFTTLQLFFAVIAKSHAMMEDCIAMFVDVITYLFNFLAERLKHKVSEGNFNDSGSGRLYRLYLELIPPFLSVVTLLIVTILGLKTAIKTLREAPKDQGSQPDITIMLWFSGLNLLLDFLNVTCFARVDQAIGISQLQNQFNLFRSQRDESSEMIATEATELLAKGRQHNGCTTCDEDEMSVSSDDTEAKGGLNLNMCSAWTHICADTLRSLAVLVAASFAAICPKIITPADADSWGSIVVSIVILASLVPLFEGLYITACKIGDVWQSNSKHRTKRAVTHLTV
ncbi:hypothetical protein FisN_29Lh064 [Fistulifera solaris]|uniref:Cation efflux protein transmembrane domain-containing protein n=1 Tax=Fistulifera solaris TaxID=1519565 RepID=A0A1Z5JLI9_FISSO|nr:hypothetical protein FisN_29Lh064 [Fistulifera solaris]|eukprot:GAX14854.1 hypothetical protein FisN_29Lh064 [Fistulifera solaris]